MATASPVAHLETLYCVASHNYSPQQNLLCQLAVIAHTSGQQSTDCFCALTPSLRDGDANELALQFVRGGNRTHKCRSFVSGVLLLS